jgi:DNA-binding IclR family transcriptional regulator
MTTPHSAGPERSVVDRTLSILGVFDRDSPTLTLSDISRRSGLPVATAHRIVTKLHGWGALERSADGGYSIGLRLWQTAVLAPRIALTEAAQPHLLELHRQTGAAAILAIRDGVESVCLSYVPNDAQPQPRTGDPGSRLPLHVTSLGLVLLAYASERVRNEVCSGPLRAYTPATITDADMLKRILARIRREGCTRVHGTLNPGIGAVAFPVRDSRGAVVAALGVAAPGEVTQPTRLMPQVRVAADAVSRCLRTDGWRLTEVGA